MIKIWTSICIDETKEDKKSVYTGAMGLNPDERRLLYWKLFAVMASSIKKTNPDFDVIAYTNDKEQVIVGKLNLTKFLESIGVRIVVLPFVKYKYPVHLGESFRNAFFKIEMMDVIAKYKDNDHYVLFDTDCMLLENSSLFRQKIESDKILAFDVYETNPQDPGPNNLSQISMGETFKELFPDYPTATPVYYGGEFISGTPSNYAEVAKYNLEIYQFCIDYAAKHGVPPKFKNGRSFFDNDEYIEAYSYNKLGDRVQKSNELMQRILVLPHYTNVSAETLKKPVWHLMQEKRTGLMLLYDLAVDKNSAFWTCKTEDFKQLVGEYVGIPERKHFYTEKRALGKRLKSMVYQAGSKIGLFK